MYGEAVRAGMAFQPLDAGRIVERVDLAGNHDLRLRGERRIEQTKLLSNDVEIVHRIAARGARDVDDVQKDLGPFDVSEKSIAETVARVRTLDEARHVGDDE